MIESFTFPAVALTTPLEVTFPQVIAFILQAKAPVTVAPGKVTVPVKNDRLASGTYPVRRIRLVVATVLPPTVPVVQDNVRQVTVFVPQARLPVDVRPGLVTVPVNVGLTLGAKLLSCVWIAVTVLLTPIFRQVAS